VSAVDLIRKGVLAVVIAVALVTLGAAGASASEPWWGLTVGAQPTNVRSGLAADEVQRLVVNATAGSLALIEPNSLTEVDLEMRSLEELHFAVVPYDATAGQMQAALEAIYQDKQVRVREVRVEGETRTYTIAFPGQPYIREFPTSTPGAPVIASAELLAVLAPEVETLSCAGATGSNCTGSAEATVVSKGRADGQLIVYAQNRGDAWTSGKVTIADQLPKGLEAVEIEGLSGEGVGLFNRGAVTCSLKSLSCKYGELVYNAGTGPPRRGLPEDLQPYEGIEMRIAVRVLPGASSGEVDTATVSGGGATKTTTASHPIEIDGQEKFGVDDYQLIPENAGGSIDTQAGSHPFQLTTVVTLNSREPEPSGARPVRLPKDTITELPAGLVGNPTPFPQCTVQQFDNLVEPPQEPNFYNECPADSQIGVAITDATIPTIGYFPLRDPIFNMEPLPGEPARFGIKVGGLTPVILDTSVRTGGDYGVTVTSGDITQLASLVSVTATIWGVPGDPRHDNARGWDCMAETGPCPASTVLAPPPLLGMPTTCSQPFETTARGDSWEAPGLPAQQAEPVTYRLPFALDGCNHLPFEPSLTVAPDIPDAASATGLTVGVHVPQTATLNPKGLAESTLKDTTVALPAGVGLNPAGGDGLLACSEAQIGFTGVEPGSGLDLFTPGLPEPFCPDASKIGTVKISTPLLPHALEGAVYLATQDANPFDSLVAMYIVARDPFSGVLVKLPGAVRLDEQTGQVVATFENTPDLPFEDLEMHFFGGERAPLGTPDLCGTYRTEASFTPWSGNEASRPASTFDITSGPNGKPCSSPLPFAPSLTAGTTSIQAGGFSPFTMTMSREDGNQDLQSIQLHMPPGLSGTLSSVKLCGEAQANAGTCGQESLIGHTTVSVGLGGHPYSVTGGEVFITDPYKGAPFGLSIVNPAKAGPFDLGKVVVRAKIEVDQSTSALTITTDPSGPYAIPHIIDGIPLQIQHVNVAIDRPQFTFNPTNCSPLAITGTLGSVQGASAALSVPLQVTNCAVLAFKPKLTADTSGKASRANGTSLHVRLTYPAGPYDANIAKVKVELPKALPSRLTTLQKACTAAVFEANPANCPVASIVGHAIATTPVLPVPLSGPAYFVSHGNESFPSLVIVLQGYGVTVHLVGTTFISKTGITSSTFKTVPDVPVGSFELTLPQGPHSALTANTNLCRAKLGMPTEFVGQNGALIRTTTKIAATGCPKARRAARRHRSASRARRRSARKRTRSAGQGRGGPGGRRG
jgi:hypothetical protein